MDNVVFTYDSSGQPSGLYIAKDAHEAGVYAEGWSKYGNALIFPEMRPAEQRRPDHT